MTTHKIVVCREGPRNALLHTLHIVGSQFVAVDEEGVVISKHFCTDEDWAYRDMVIPGEAHKAAYEARYPDGYIIDPRPNTELQDLLEERKNA